MYVCVCRLKTLLPQSQVQDPKQLTEKLTTNHKTQSKERKRDNKETEDHHNELDDFDSDNCDSSDDTIDEFVSSEDISQTNQRTFSRAGDKVPLGSRHLGLPSMLSIHYNSAIGLSSTVATRSGELKRVSGTSSARSSGSITVGSLQQTSLELSDDSSCEEHIAATAVGETSDQRSKLMKEDNPGNRESNEKDGLLQPSLDLSLEDCSPSRHNRHKENDNNQTLKNGKDQLSGGEEWHLMLDCSSEEEKSIDGKNFTDQKEDVHVTMSRTGSELREELTPKSADSTITPPAKRRKSSRERKRRKSHLRRGHTDLLTPVEGEMTTSTRPKKLFHEDKSKKKSPKIKKKKRKSRSERNRKRLKETIVIDLTQEDGSIDLEQETGVTGITEPNYVINDKQKGKSPTEGRPHSHSKNTDHQQTETPGRVNLVSSDSIPEIDSDVTFCEDPAGSESYSNVSDVLGSPSYMYLPPTPGRENVASILNRKSIAFSE